MEIAFCNMKTIDCLSASLAKILLVHFNNESTAEHASVWQKMITFLQVYQKVPVNATTLLLEQYSKCTVAGFCQHFNTLVSVCHPDLESVSTILMEGQNTERWLKSEGRWNPTKKQGSVFLGANKDKEKKGDKQDVKKEKANNDKKPPTHDRNGNPIDHHPPKSGEAHKRTNALTG